MSNNAIISMSFEDLLNILDARTTVTLFIDFKDGSKGDLVRNNKKVYELINDEALMPLLRAKVIGLSHTLGVTSILIKEV